MRTAACLVGIQVWSFASGYAKGITMRALRWATVWLIVGGVESTPAQASSNPLESQPRRDMPPPVQSWFPQAPPLPVPQVEVIRVATVEELLAAMARVKPGGTVLIADGHYWLRRCLRLRTDRITLRGETGDRTRVILDGARCQDGQLVALHACSGVTIADLTVQNVRHNGIKINCDSNVQQVTLHNLILHNTIHDPTNHLGRLIRLVHDNEGLLVANNLLSGPPLRNESSSRMTLHQNPATNLAHYFADAATGNLHLKSPRSEAVGCTEAVNGVADDIDRQPRHGRPVLGADEVGDAGR